MKPKQPVRSVAKVSAQSQVLDEAARRRAALRHLEELERDNFTVIDEIESISFAKKNDITPVASTATSNIPKARRKQKIREVKRLLLLKKTLTALLEESNLTSLPPETPSYLNCSATPSKLPPRKFCSVCGFTSQYNCIKCGMKYCSLKCKAAHEEMRCMKFTI